jgi:predicted  nucleic acid-binding Zn-ribbon protein
LEENQADKERIEKKMAAIEEELKDIVTNIDKLRKDLSTQKVNNVSNFHSILNAISGNLIS